MLYRLEPRWKKSVVELQHWSKMINGKKVWIEREEGWRWAHCTFESDEVPDIDLEGNQSFYIFEELEVIDYESDDGCWTHTNFYANSDLLTEEEKEEIGDMGYSELEEEGWEHEETDTIFTGPLVLYDENDNEVVVGSKPESN
jgi:hypothetical protein